MIWTASSHQETDRHRPPQALSSKRSARIEGRRGSTLVAALALVFLIFAVTTVCLTRIACLYAEAGRQRSQASALYLAEAGIQKAAHRLAGNGSYVGEKGTRLPTGTFDVEVTRGGAGYAVTSTGHADSPFNKHPRRTVRATVTVILSSSKGGGAFRITDWRENR